MPEFVETDIERGPAPGVPTAVVYARTVDVPALSDPRTQCLTYLASLPGRTALAAIVDSDEQNQHVRNGTAFVESEGRRANLIGFPVYHEGELLHPRFDLVVDDRLQSSTGIAEKWLRLCWEAIELSAKGELLNLGVAEDRNVILEKVDVLTTEWNDDGPEDAPRYVIIDEGMRAFTGPNRSTRG